jgi:hypothetical protein
MEATFWLPAPEGGRWTARAGGELHGRGVRYGRMGRVGEVERTQPLASGPLRVHVRLSRTLRNPDPAKFSLAPS